MDKLSNRVLFKKAIFDGMSQKYDEELSANEETPDCSKKHYLKMSKILNFQIDNVRKTNLNKRTLIAILIAAALLLTSCSVYIFREEIFNFIEEVYDKYIRVSYNEDHEGNGETIEKIYSVNYIPEGYELKEEVSNPLMVYYMWENAAGESIVFEQFNLSSSEFLLDGEQGSTMTFEHNQLKIYFRQIDNSYYYIWSDGYYAITINSSVEIDKNELIQIIDNMEIK